MKRVCVLPGDGIGPEVIECAVRSIQKATNDVEFQHGEIGQSAFQRRGSHLPPETLDLMRSCDSTLFGAVSSSETSSHESPVLRFRRELDLFANVRPVRTIVAGGARQSIDVIIVRENSEGMYTQHEVFDDDGVTTLRRVSRRACERIVDFAIDLTRQYGRRSICCVHKSNVLRASDGLFVRIFRDRMSSAGADLTAEEHLVDSAAMKLVTEPKRFDVIVTLNLYGDILSDVAAGAAGGLGFAPSGNIGPRSSVFEPCHGSAPDIAGRGIANPTAAILAGAMMLRHLGKPEDASRIESAIAKTYGSGNLTTDIGGTLGSASFTELVLSNM